MSTVLEANLTMVRAGAKVETFINPAGFIEQHYIGSQTGPSVTKGTQKLQRLAQDMQMQRKPVLILVDLTKVNDTNIGSHKAAIQAMRDIKFKNAAIYGPLSLQILINTLAIVADRHQKVRAFESRVDALKWLRRDL